MNNPFPKNQTNNPETSQPNNPQVNHSESQPVNKGLFSLPPALMSMVPWIPLMLEMTTGQKIPQMTGSIGEIQQGIQQIQMVQVQIIQNQAQLDQRLTALENSASHQFTNLVNQVQSIKSVRLTHDRERKQIEFNNQPERNPNFYKDQNN